MKYAAALILGLLTGVALFVMGLYYNPFTDQQSISPLAVSSDRVLDLTYSSVPGEGILYTNDGESTAEPHPNRVVELWEAAVADTSVHVTTLYDARGLMAGIGVKSSTPSEVTNVLAGEALMSSTWHIYLPGSGTLVIDQTENLWSYLRNIVIPAHSSSGDNWKGSFHGITTAGPGALGTARVTGGSGIFAGLTSEAVESLTAKGYSAETGPVAMSGGLTITVPEINSQTEAAPE